MPRRDLHLNVHVIHFKLHLISGDPRRDGCLVLGCLVLGRTLGWGRKRGPAGCTDACCGQLRWAGKPEHVPERCRPYESREGFQCLLVLRLSLEREVDYVLIQLRGADRKAAVQRRHDEAVDALQLVVGRRGRGHHREGKLRDNLRDEDVQVVRLGEVGHAGDRAGLLNRVGPLDDGLRVVVPYGCVGLNQSWRLLLPRLFGLRRFRRRCAVVDLTVVRGGLQGLQAHHKVLACVRYAPTEDAWSHGIRHRQGRARPGDVVTVVVAIRRACGTRSGSAVALGGCEANVRVDGDVDVQQVQLDGVVPLAVEEPQLVRQRKVAVVHVSRAGRARLRARVRLWRESRRAAIVRVGRPPVVQRGNMIEVPG